MGSLTTAVEEFPCLNYNTCYLGLHCIAHELSTSKITMGKPATVIMILKANKLNIK